MWMIQIVTDLDFKMSLFQLPYRVESGPENMATDMWILEKTKQWGGPIFRRYGWSGPHLTFGYGQKASWVQRESGKPLKKMTRRPTGGGIVRHGTDLTYCLSFFRGSKAEQTAPMELYGQIHQRWGEALLEQDVSNTLMPCPVHSDGGIPGDCFKEPVGRDLMDSSATKKLAGAAMKRTRMGLLIQGTLDLSGWPKVNHQRLGDKFLCLIASDLEESIQPRDWPEEMVAERHRWAQTFASLEWTKNRKKNLS